MQPATLYDCEHGLFCWCTRCSHNAVVPIRAVTRRLGERYPVPDTAKHLVCSDHGSKDIAVRPNWPAVGVVRTTEATPLTDDIDICRAATLYIDQRGGQAALQAAMQADALLEAGDLDGAERAKRLENLTRYDRLQCFPAFARRDQASHPAGHRHDDRPRRTLIVGQHLDDATAAGEAHGYRLFLVVFRQMLYRTTSVSTICLTVLGCYCIAATCND